MLSYMTNNHLTAVLACGQIEQDGGYKAIDHLVQNSIAMRKMSSKVIIQLFSLTIIVLFSSGFAQNRTSEAYFQDLFGLSENLPGTGQRILPGDFCGVRGWRRVVSVNARSGKCPNNFRLDSAGSGIRVCRGDTAVRPLLGGSRIHRTTFNVSGLLFTKVAGFVEGYQFGSPDAFI